MLKSIQSKLVLMFVLVILSVMMTAGTFIISNVTGFYYDDFLSQMKNTVFDENFIKRLNETTSSQVPKEKLKELLEAYYGRIGVDSYRNFAVLDGKDGSYIMGSNEVELQNIETTTNVLLALNGQLGEDKNIKSPYIDYAYPVIKDKKVSYIIYIYETKEELNTFSKSMFTVILQAMLVGLVIAVILGYLLAKTITTPIKNITFMAEKISKGIYEVGEKSISKDEIGVLTNTFRNMGTRLRETIFQTEDQKTKLETIMEYSSDGIVAFDTQGKLILINPIAKRYLNLNDTSNITFDELFSQMFENVSLGDFIYLENDKQIAKEIQLNDYYLKFYLAKFIYSDKTIGGIMVDVQNITQMKKLELSRREFVANVSHELRTPLTTVKAYVETLQAGGVDRETQTRFYETVNKECDRMTRLVSDLLTLSRLDNGVKLNLHECKIENLLTDVIEKMQFEAMDKNQKLTYSVINEVPIICIDEDKIEQVIINIISNAIKYTQNSGTIKVFSSFISPNVIISVKDNGMGIGKEHLSRIFERFYRVDKARSREQGGTGLGLAIAKEIINAHAGDITIQSEVTIGTQVTLTIPIDDKSASYNETVI